MKESDKIEQNTEIVVAYKGIEDFVTEDVQYDNVKKWWFAGDCLCFEQGEDLLTISNTVIVPIRSFASAEVRVYRPEEEK